MTTLRSVLSLLESYRRGLVGSSEVIKSLPKEVADIVKCGDCSGSGETKNLEKLLQQSLNADKDCMEEGCAKEGIPLAKDFNYDPKTGVRKSLTFNMTPVLSHTPFVAMRQCGVCGRTSENMSKSICSSCDDARTSTVWHKGTHLE